MVDWNNLPKAKIALALVFLVIIVGATIVGYLGPVQTGFM